MEASFLSISPSNKIGLHPIPTWIKGSTCGLPRDNWEIPSPKDIWASNSEPVSTYAGTFTFSSEAWERLHLTKEMLNLHLKTMIWT
jgi:hypothetical protein